MHLAVGVAQVTFLLHGQPGKAVVGWVAEDDEDSLLPLHLVGSIALSLEFMQEQLLRVPGGRPAGQRIGEVDAGAFAVLSSRWRAQSLQEQAELEVGDDVRRGQELESEDPLAGGLLRFEGCEISPTLFLRVVAMDGAKSLNQIGAGAAAGVEDDDARSARPSGDANSSRSVIHAGHHVLDDLLGRVPDAEFFAQLRVEGFEEGLVEILDGVFLGEVSEEGGPVHPVERGGRPVEHSLHQAMHCAGSVSSWRSLRRTGRRR